MQEDQNAEPDPIFRKDLDLECDPRKSDRSEAWMAGYEVIIQHSLRSFRPQNGTLCNRVRDRYVYKVAHTLAQPPHSSRCGHQLCKQHERSNM
jgi:hypothetical protein